VLVLKDYDKTLLPSILDNTFIKFEDRKEFANEKELIRVRNIKLAEVN
jgi:hypothetical protein